MVFNFGKCKCIHVGHGNVSKEYFMGNTILGTSVKEKDLGVTVSADSLRAMLLQKAIR